MDDRTALHTAARRFCQSRFSEWFEKYRELQATEKWQVEDMFKRGWDYSEEAYRIFPHYRVDKAIPVEVEKLTPDSSATVDELRSQLLRSGEIATARLHEELQKEKARKALHEEAEDYRAYIQALAVTDLADIDALPYRRVLREEETKQLRNQLKLSWGIEHDSWFPLREGPIPANVMTFHTDYFKKMEGLRVLREALALRGIERIFQLHEFNLKDEPDYEIEVSLFEPAYGGGGEQYSTTALADWVVYASHESSITICGQWLVRFLAERWPEWSQHTYLGPYSTADLRGTWDSK